MEVTGVAQASPPAIALSWNVAAYPVTQQRLFRRAKGAATWSQIGALAVGATSYADLNVVLGVEYEYRVTRTLTGGPGEAFGYLSSGIRVPAVMDRGRVILLVDETMAGPLAPELARLESDLIGDGWRIVRQDVARTATPPSIRSAIQSIYNVSPATTRAVILFGRIPVPYSGDAAIDGHGDHAGAWPADLYYGEMNGSWTDTIVSNSTATDSRNRNIPGDGKFDQTSIPSNIELQVGRIDFAKMLSFGSETELLRRYLDRDHAYRHRLGGFANVGKRALVDDHFGYLYGEAFAVTAWRSFTACVGVGNVQSLDWFGTLQTESYLWAYGCGSGTYQSADGVGSSADFVSKDSRAVFTMLFGSYFGDWDTTNAFLRAPLAGTASSLGLVSCWAGRPHWFFHPMALGETVGYSARLTQNNSGSQQGGYDGNYGLRYNHVALLGDPTLRLYPVAPATDLTADITANAVILNWTASPDAPIEGYSIARANSASGPFVLLQSGLVTDTTFVDGTVTPGQNYTYLVRAVKLETSPAGSYFNPSQGAFSVPVIAGTVNGPEIDVTGNGNPISVGDPVPRTATGTDFGAVEIPGSVTKTYTIANVGVRALIVSGFEISGENAAEFVVVEAPPATLAAGSSAPLEVRFTPSAPGLRSAVLTLTNSDADEGSYQFAIGGQGLPSSAGIAIYPPALNRSLNPGTATTETVAISNPALGTLIHTISSSLARYAARDSNAFGGPVYSWVDISATGAEIGGWSGADDLISDPIFLSFDFPFYDASFNAVRVCTNGYLSFTDTNTSGANQPLPAWSGAANMIAPLWTDLAIGNNSKVYWQVIDGRFVVQFEGVTLYADPSADLTFQVILEPDGALLFHYKTLTALGGIYTIGLQNGARDEALLVAHNTPYLQPGMAIRIRPPDLESWLSLSASAGTVAPGDTQQIEATLNTAGLAPGDYYAELTVESNAQGQESRTIPVHLTVGNTPIENWRFLKFGSVANTGNGADIGNGDGDEGNNLLEYALARDPLVPETTALTSIGISANGCLQIRFERDATRTDLRYIVEATSDLTASWTPIASGIHGAPVIATGAQSSSETGAGDVKTVIVEDSAPVATFPARFLRLRVVRD